ncbi:Rne/Rng family ribonuclease [Schleiferiaceae bacterium]|jgi:ribonuclease G|nr:Rne/Rng family ribonuclease [Schleiferiaceae bacterium]MDB4124867.1 Rne/Rng family ribonuclease [Schleiferiaceae bacterium]MDB4176735.1 Rne/Rng family ribonuclease [Schleiferiaceae bacterium]MDB9802333.1 Rne/Rng family ribonuclease [Schleiferiaceae bacterium]MDC1537986.1 Rne/Rng family ribonuclease [Schleiferiaceae bacterium]
MKTELVISASSDQADIALLEDGRLQELIKEKGDDSFSVGDVYLGTVKKLATGLNAAFVDVGYEKDAFLHYHDLGPQIKSWQTYLRRTLKGKQLSNITNFKAEPNIEKEGNIGDVLKQGDQILVQITKEPISTKGPRITAELSIAGRFVVLVPFSNRVSVSQKIRERDEKDRLKKLVRSIKPKGFGVIIRTVAKGQSAEELQSDLDNLVRKWSQLHKSIKRSNKPVRIFREMNRASAFLRDVFNESFTSITIDNKDLCEEVKDYLDEIKPGASKMVKEYSGQMPLFQFSSVDRQIKGAFGRSVSMTKGAYLIIEHTEALHVVDVNSGNRTNTADNQESNALQVNLLAAVEVARQLRLRDMGGIVVIDFIDMNSAENRKAVYEKMESEMKRDRARHKILPISRFGLMELTRQRVRPETNITTREENPDNLVEAPIQVIDAMASKLAQIEMREVYIHVHPFIESYLTKGFFSSIKKTWQKKFRKKIVVVPRDAFTMLEWRVMDKDNNAL